MLNTFLTVVFVLISVLMIFIVLLQRGRGGGLVGAFGAGGGQSAFGTKTGDVFTTATVIIFVVFLLLAFILNWRVGAAPKMAPTPTSQQTAPSTSSGNAVPSAAPGGKSAGLASSSHTATLPTKSAAKLPAKSPATTKP
ncbi:MAG: preprotein translocase subunit SecG [Phycisphaerae bacterium]